MKGGWSRPLNYAAVIAVVAGAYFIGIGNRGDSAANMAVAMPPDPGYAARDARVIETGYDGRERYRLDARVIRQQSETGAIDLEDLRMDYHPASQARLPGEQPSAAATGTAEVWHVRSDHGKVRADGDDVQLDGNVVVSGQPPGSGDPLTLSTETMRINTPTQFIETEAPVKLTWSGHTLSAVGMQYDLKAGMLSLESEVHGEFSPK
jgi:LPS export ABC transporter protein LptC